MEKYVADITADIEITPEELAKLFWSMDEIEMRKFFNALGREADFTLFSSQIYAAVNNHRQSEVTLTNEAKNIMREIGYSVDI